MYLLLFIPWHERGKPRSRAWCLRLTQAIAALEKTEAEIILRRDGSTDATWKAIEAPKQAVAQLVGVKLSANRGHNSP